MTTHLIAQKLLSWYHDHKRDLPWRKTQDPYIVWISEVILQQTRVDQGLPYFHAFISNFPTVQDLAIAEEDQVLKCWEGLGYYSRARNLHAGAKYIANDCGGIFPSSYDSLLKVKGIGPYTAAAIASICFGEATPVLDGNVFRVTARHFGIHDDIAKASSRKSFISTLEQIIPEQHPGDFNQAIMELGATICKPQSPDCQSCPITASCYAYEKKAQSSLPVKIKKVKVRDRFFHYLVLEAGGQSALQKRSAGDVWQGLYDFYLEEHTNRDASPDFLKFVSEAASLEVSDEYKHVLSHQHIHARFYHARLSDKKNFQKLADELHLERFSWADIVALPKPRLIVNYLNEKDF